tara:strand:- start:599 stop:1132 length:534 start_codon:yes stop_codon:yes gene_type:complete
MKNIDIESHRLSFRRLSNNYVSEDYVSWLNDVEVNMFLETRGNYNLKKLSLYVERLYKNEAFFWAIIRKDNGKHIGNIKIDPIDFKTSTGEYGILIGDKGSWGQGFAKESTIRILDFCFNDLKLSKISLGLIEENIKAFKLYKKIGFQIDEIKSAGIYNNKFCNSLRMSLNVKSYRK